MHVSLQLIQYIPLLAAAAQRQTHTHSTVLTFKRYVLHAPLLHSIFTQLSCFNPFKPLKPLAGTTTCTLQ